MAPFSPLALAETGFAAKKSERRGGTGKERRVAIADSREHSPIVCSGLPSHALALETPKALQRREGSSDLPPLIMNSSNCSVGMHEPLYRQARPKGSSSRSLRRTSVKNRRTHCSKEGLLLSSTSYRRLSIYLSIPEGEGN